MHTHKTYTKHTLTHTHTHEYTHTHTHTEISSKVTALNMCMVLVLFVSSSLSVCRSTPWNISSIVYLSIFTFSSFYSCYTRSLSMGLLLDYKVSINDTFAGLLLDFCWTLLDFAELVPVCLLTACCEKELQLL